MACIGLSNCTHVVVGMLGILIRCSFDTNPSRRFRVSSWVHSTRTSLVEPRLAGIELLHKLTYLSARWSCTVVGLPSFLLRVDYARVSASRDRRVAYCWSCCRRPVRATTTDRSDHPAVESLVYAVICRYRHPVSHDKVIRLTAMVSD